MEIDRKLPRGLIGHYPPMTDNDRHVSTGDGLQRAVKVAFAELLSGLRAEATVEKGQTYVTSREHLLQLRRGQALRTLSQAEQNSASLWQIHIEAAMAGVVKDVNLTGRKVIAHLIERRIRADELFDREGNRGGLEHLLHLLLELPHFLLGTIDPAIAVDTDEKDVHRLAGLDQSADELVEAAGLPASHTLQRQSPGDETVQADVVVRVPQQFEWNPQQLRRTGNLQK